jgi:ADP-heptose:LPS heptosyltransferase
MASRLPALASMPGIDSILVVRLKALGDIVLSLPIVYALRETFPAARIAYLCRPQYAEALSGVRALDEVFTLPSSLFAQGTLALRLRSRRFDCVIDLLGSPRSAILAFLTGARIRIGMDTGRRNHYYHYLLPRVIVRDGLRVKCYTLQSNLELIGMLGLRSVLREEAARAEADGSVSAGGAAGFRRSRGYDPRWLAIGFPAAESEQEWARQYARGIGAGRSALIGIVPGSVYQAKSWPLEHVASLARMVAEELHCTALILWGPGEEAIARRVVEESGTAVLAPPTGIARLGALISTLSVLVGPDSGPKHIAVVLGVPTVTLFGPTDPAIWDPMTERHRAVVSGRECAPCRKRTCEPNACLADISPRRVLEEIADVLAIAPRGTAGMEGGLP